MEIPEGKTCRFCEFFRKPFCPFYGIVIVSVDRQVCLQYESLHDVSLYRERMKLKDNEPEEEPKLKRSLEF